VGTTARLVWMPPIDPAQRMRSRRRHVLRIGLAIAAEPARGLHALFERHKPAILAFHPGAVNRTPRIILGFAPFPVATIPTQIPNMKSKSLMTAS
jgi:hypothetical protein